MKATRMSHHAVTTAPAPASAVVPKNLQAKSTVGILNTVRWLSVGVFALGIVGGGIVALFGLVDGNMGAFAVGVFCALLSGVYGALAFAFIGWFVDSLDLLTQIARNTHRP